MCLKHLLFEYMQIHLFFSGILPILLIVSRVFSHWFYFTVQAIRSGIDVLVGTPGRIKDHIEKGNLDFRGVRHVVLDEVDRMLDMGFADDVETIISSAYQTG